MTRSLATLFGFLIPLWFSSSIQAQPPSTYPRGDQSAALQIPVQATLQVEPCVASPGDNHGATSEVFNEAAPLFSGHFVGGAGAYIIKPFFQSNPAFFTEVVQYTARPVPSGIMAPIGYFSEASSIVPNNTTFAGI
jgi:hypothetical protein